MVKAQVSIEFFIAFSILLLLFGVSSFIYYQRYGEIKFSSQILEAERYCHQISSTIAEVAANGNNFAKVVAFPEKIELRSYSIVILGSLRIAQINLGNETLSCSIQTDQVSNKTSSDFELLKKRITFENLNGVVIIS